MESRCTRCLLPERPPWLELDNDGICTACRAPEPRLDAPAEAALTKPLKKTRGRGDYDCGVLCSGGVDSTAALWLMVRHYGARPLALTLDHGMISDSALVNMRQAAESLEIDHVAFSDDTPRRLAAAMIERGGRAQICQACAPWFLETAQELARRFELPFLVTGWTCAEHSPREPGARAVCGFEPTSPAMGPAADDTQRFLAAEPDTLRGAQAGSLVQAIGRFTRRRQPMFAPLVYHPPPAEGWPALLARELGWQPPAEATPWKSTPCALATVSADAGLGELGLGAARIQLSDRVRRGELNREVAEALLAEHPPLDRASAAARLDPWPEDTP